MAPNRPFSLLLKVALITQIVFAVPTQETSQTCLQIQTALPGKAFFERDPVYTKENRDYYNIGLADLKPACITMPSSAEDVSTIVAILNAHQSVPYAIKSGGHDPNPGHSSIKDGVLIALRQLKGTEYDAEKKVAYVKPGGHWSDVLTPLAKQGVTVVSGRLGRYNE
jgi:FAD/FMN-containing dehydrogenase